ncbi:MAG: MATE family efflux transporter, partial [Symbiobacteriaceae bacterium]|nr:MATE family efflux transporter [Symbiobacteriaceae bacterium]
DTKWTLISTFVGMWVVRLVIARILVGYMGWGLSGAWVALAADQLVRSAIIIYRYRTGKWKEIQV